MNLGFDLKEWESVEAIEMGERETLELGGHEVIIMDARLYESPVSHNVSLKVCVDIAGNDKQKGFFKKQFDNNKLSEAKWPSGATKYLSLKKESLAYTKGFIKALENSNNGFKFNTSMGWEQLNGLKCAGVFGLEEYTKQDGTVGTATKLVQFRSLEKLNDIEIPKVKLLDGTLVSIDDYNEFYRKKNQENPFDGIVEIDESQMPF